jgi:hypothetical protein
MLLWPYNTLPFPLCEAGWVVEYTFAEIFIGSRTVAKPFLPLYL